MIKEPPSADCNVTGSDQVWHEPLGSDFDAYYLPFGGGGTRRVSYAASIGREMSNTEIACFGERVRRLDAVGVREKSAVEACKRVGVRAELVLDSTLLLPADTYRRLLIGKDEPTLSESYIFAYVLNTPNAASFCWNGIKAFAKKAGQTTMATYSSGYIPAKEILPGARATYPMVEGWLSLVRNADFVVTSSFHGVVFAILFHRKFLAIPLGPKSRYADERVVCLLEELGLANRIYHADKAIEAQLERSIDWASVDKKLNALRNGSLAFLHLCTMYPLS